jgi:hypothetical protein
MRTLIFCCIFSFSLNAMSDANDCVNVLKASTIRTTKKANKKEVEENARDFCSQYSKYKSSASSQQFGAEYKFLSASMGSSNADVDSVASYYCDKSNDYKSSESAYDDYVEAIAPGGMEAYKQCLTMKQAGVNFDLNPASMLEKEFNLDVSYLQRTGKKQIEARLKYVPTDGITCSWIFDKDNAEHENETLIIKSPGSAVLKCKRENIENNGTVTVFMTNADKNSITIPWNKDISKSKFSELESAIKMQNNKLDGLKVNLSTMPGYPKWVELNGTGCVQKLEKLEEVSNHVCYLAGIGGSFTGGGENVNVYVREKSWFVEVNTCQSYLKASVGCSEVTLNKE